MPWLLRMMVKCSRAASETQPRVSGARLRLRKRTGSRNADRRSRPVTPTDRSLSLATDRSGLLGSLACPNQQSGFEPKGLTKRYERASALIREVGLKGSDTPALGLG